MRSLVEESTDQLIPISVATLFRGTMPGFDIFVRSKGSRVPLLFCSADQEFFDEPTRVSQHEKLFIHRDNRDRYQLYLRQNYNASIADDRIPVTQRLSVLSEVIRDVLGEQFANGTTESIVETCQTFGKSSVALLGSELVVPSELCSVLHHDFGTFTHSANVSAYSVVLGRALGYCRSDLEQIAVGGLLHDIGKLDICETILNKPGRLTDDEFTKIKMHPTTGLQRVGTRSDLSYDQMMMIYQHHERLDGSGYPVGCSANEIHPWGKLCAIVDVFEALTSDRPYRAPYSRATAFAVLEKGNGVEFDREMLLCWRRLLGL
jgi:HD-GYP domain-containing protein (c-di-GMP phosphodiesterase class II)